MEYGRRIVYAVGTDGRLHEVTYRNGISDYFSGLLTTCADALYQLPNVMFMGKIHGVQHKARQGKGKHKWVERNPKHLNGNGNKNGKKR